MKILSIWFIPLLMFIGFSSCDKQNIEPITNEIEELEQFPSTETIEEEDVLGDDSDDDSRNSTSFRLLWIVCVGTVALASGFMGAVGGELVRLRNLKPLPDIPDSFWISYAVAIAGMVAAGCFSYQRPACDIFIVGITQFPSTVYITLALLQFDATRSTRRSVDGTMWWRLLGMAGFLLNAPLLPLYPILVQYTDWSLASVNTLLHAWLTVSWSMQGISMYHAGKCINKETRKQI